MYTYYKILYIGNNEHIREVASLTGIPFYKLRNEGINRMIEGKMKSGGCITNYAKRCWNDALRQLNLNVRIV